MFFKLLPVPDNINHPLQREIAVPQAWLSLIVIAPCGLPFALACRRLWRLGYPAAAWAAIAVLRSATVGASLFAGLLGPVAIAVYAVVISLPVWIVCWLVDRRR